MVSSRAISGEIVRVYIEGILCACSSVTVSYDIDGIPEIQISMPATPDIAQCLQPRLRVDVLLMDPSRVDFPLLTSFTEGEILDYSFYKSASGQRSFSARAAHFTHAWLHVPLHVLSVDEQITKTLKNEDTFQTFGPGTIKGSVFELFSPKNVQKTLKELGKEYIRPSDSKTVNDASTPTSEYKDNFNIYDYVIAAARFYEAVAGEAITKDSYDFKELNIYKPSERFFYPTEGSKIQWDSFFQNLVALYYSGILGGEGGELTYLAAIRQILSILLHELVIIPNARSQNRNIITKPILAFSPIPRCNFILPIFSPTFEWSFSHESKPTRLIQYTIPPMMTELQPELVKYYRNIAPEELKRKFDLFDEKTTIFSQDAVSALAELKNKDTKFTMVTEEEKRRGIIVSTNDIPGYMSTAISLLYKGGTNLEKTSTGNPVKTKTTVAQKIGEKPNTVSAVETAAEGALRIAIYDEMLRARENTNGADIGGDDVAFLNRNDTYVPKRFIIVSYDKEYYSRSAGLLAPHYNIRTSGSSTPIADRLTPRYFGVFKECKNDLPKILHFDVEMSAYYNSPFNNTNPARANAIQGAFFRFLCAADEVSEAAENANAFRTRIPEYYKTKVSVETSLAAMTGYPDRAVIINIPPDIITLENGARQIVFSDERVQEKVAELIILISLLSEPQISLDAEEDIKNAVYSYAELGINPQNSSNYTLIGTPIIDNIRKIIQRKKSEIEREANEKMKKRNTSKGITEALKLLAKKYNQQEDDVLSDYYGKVSNIIPQATDATSEDSAETTALDEQTLKSIRDRYTQPLCNFFFYYNRFSNSGRNMPLSFNPYIVPGFSALIKDNANEEYPIHILGYVTKVTHEFSATSISTSINLSLMRRIDDFADSSSDIPQLAKTASGYALDLFLSDEKDEEKKLKSLQTISQSLQNMPFYGGEWMGSELDKTIKDFLGPMGESASGATPTVLLSELYNDSSDPSDIITAFKRVRRPFPVVQVQARYRNDQGDSKYLSQTQVKEQLLKIAKEGNGSLYDIAKDAAKPKEYNQKGQEIQKKAEILSQYLISIETEFTIAPSNVIAVYDINSIGLIDLDVLKFPEELVVQKAPAFTKTAVRSFIRKHTELCRQRTGIIGGDKIS
jgi:hypothetical protein